MATAAKLDMWSIPAHPKFWFHFKENEIFTFAEQRRNGTEWTGWREERGTRKPLSERKRKSEVRWWMGGKKNTYSFYIRLTHECWQRSDRKGHVSPPPPFPSPWVNWSIGCADVAMECQPSRRKNISCRFKKKRERERERKEIPGTSQNLCQKTSPCLTETRITVWGQWYSRRWLLSSGTRSFIVLTQT